MRKALKVLAVPILIALYVLCLGPLLVRDGCQLLLIGMDKAFDWIAVSVGWDPRFWPLPAASDNPLPYEEFRRP